MSKLKHIRLGESLTCTCTYRGGGGATHCLSPISTEYICNTEESSSLDGEERETQTHD